jgi:hypothetical protein
MRDHTLLRTSLLALAAVAATTVATAASPAPETAAAEYASMPAGRLGAGVSPRAYRLHLELCVALNDAKGDELKAAVAKRL